MACFGRGEKMSFGVFRVFESFTVGVFSRVFGVLSFLHLELLPLSVDTLVKVDGFTKLLLTRLIVNF